MKILRLFPTSLLIFTLFISACSSDKKQNSAYDLSSYNQAVSEGVVLVDFYATWCGPCKMMAPHVESLKKEYGSKLTVVKVDTDKSIEVASHFKITSIPLVKVYNNGEQVYDKIGYHSKEELKSIIEKYL